MMIGSVFLNNFKDDGETKNHMEVHIKDALFGLEIEKKWIEIFKKIFFD